jgi:two-component system cell cycle sensor histidine kinase/response regulator CckA
MEAVGRLAGGVAHDFNNVLTAIFGYADLLLDSFDLGDPRRQDIDEIKRASQRAAGLTRQLLAFSRKQVMQPQRINLNEIILNLETLLLKLIGQDIVLHINPAPSLWDVKADPGQVEQVLMNLASNARDAMPDGGHLTISTANEALEPDDAVALVGIEPGRFVRLTVSDTGQGIPDNVRAHVFEPFFTTKELGKGTGLGLATVYGIVKQSGGWVYLDETPGSGASFRIYLPRIED